MKELPPPPPPPSLFCYTPHAHPSREGDSTSNGLTSNRESLLEPHHCWQIPLSPLILSPPPPSQLGSRIRCELWGESPKGWLCAGRREGACVLCILQGVPLSSAPTRGSECRRGTRCGWRGRKSQLLPPPPLLRIYFACLFNCSPFACAGGKEDE